MLRATMAVWLVLPPTEVIKPANTLRLNCSMSAGDRSCATRISVSLLSLAPALVLPCRAAGQAWPRM